MGLHVEEGEEEDDDDSSQASSFLPSHQFLVESVECSDENEVRTKSFSFGVDFLLGKTTRKDESKSIIDSHTQRSDE